MRTRCIKRSMIKLIITMNLFVFGIMNSNASCTYESNVNATDLPIGVMLNWSTTNEVENNFFAIERSTDGINFVEIGQVEASGTSSNSIAYSFLDVTGNSTNVYYRLNQHDFDGTSTVTDILRISKAQKNNFLVNRIMQLGGDDHLVLSIEAYNSGKLSFELSNWKNELATSDEIAITEGHNVLSIDMSALKSGLYSLKMKMDDEEEKITISKENSDESRQMVASTRK